MEILGENALAKRVKIFRMEKKMGCPPDTEEINKIWRYSHGACPNCPAPETQKPAYKECASAKAVWRVASTQFKTRFIEVEKQKLLLSVVIRFHLWNRRGIAEVRQ